jgi:hypothetical protein
MVSFLNALKLEKVSVTPNSLPNVLEAIFSEILGNLVREATIMKFSELLLLLLYLLYAIRQIFQLSTAEVVNYRNLRA